ncbi:TPA: hypothetical protein EYP70_02725 [Candidatus Bathyarchaeota archaeon]|nr:hypothetical protein [Candidatus Bathyarchaeota archaeon]
MMEVTHADVIPEHRVACLTTNSLREITDIFVSKGSDPTYLITELRAVGSKAEEKQVYPERSIMVHQREFLNFSLSRLSSFSNSTLS